LKPYGKKIGRGLKGSRFLDNGCPCCGREHDHKGATRQKAKQEILKEVPITRSDRELLRKYSGRKVSS
jgi:hypothetical protein